jgi:hypothetical protein
MPSPHDVVGPQQPPATAPGCGSGTVLVVLAICGIGLVTVGEVFNPNGRIWRYFMADVAVPNGRDVRTITPVDPTAIAVTADALTEAYEENEVAADRRFKGKRSW